MSEQIGTFDHIIHNKGKLNYFHFYIVLVNKYCQILRRLGVCIFFFLFWDVDWSYDTRSKSFWDKYGHFIKRIPFRLPQTQQNIEQPRAFLITIISFH